MSDWNCGVEMKQFTMKLKDNQRPIVNLKKWNRLDAMIDTGALFPVWIAEESLLQDLGAVLIKDSISFGGFGGETKGSLYKIDDFILEDMIFPQLYVIACLNEKLPCHMILSATMFRNLIYEIDDKNHRLNVTIPDDETNVRSLVIEDENGKLHVLVQSEK